ncbi:MAG: serine protease, partial [Minicystis sp.]
MPRPSLRLRLLTSLALPLLAIALVHEARAEAPAAPLVRLLAAPGRRRALSDDQGRVPFTVALPPGADALSLGLLPVAPGFGAKRLAPSALLAFASEHPELALAFAPPRQALIDNSKGWTRVETFRKNAAAAGAGIIDGTGVIVGIIDTGLDVRHADFRDKSGKTRVAWLMAANAPEGLHPDLEKTYGCTDAAQSACAIYAGGDIDALIAQDSDRLVDAEGHGTHVTS